ncbi:TetR/AcrR family transcriptional regulator [Streptomyces sp. TLI_185]|uniref:TetR/AcrR family transcriptional regulator n=1 Tax=Streptomyces sp. TLI_185 TaxID=2485151 RepID=UPI000FA8C4A4|nr:TetR/AcrR family transcriptional regulator [Streptomyces sp. TLI_185]RPF38428.1 TetR family transcriptional regulator [Streptomyces sp. TLI_185]
MTGRSAPPAPRRPGARSTRTRILEAALHELARSPDSTLADIAEAAGVARRTVYVHFAARSALVEGITADAAEAIRGAVAATGAPGADAATALARFVLTLWPVGDRYRVLIGLARQDLGPDRVDEVLSPARAAVTAILALGQQQGIFHTRVPPAPLGRALEALLLALLDGVNAGSWADDGTRAATAALIAAGVGSDAAATKVHRLHTTGQAHPPL